VTLSQWHPILGLAILLAIAPAAQAQPAPQVQPAPPSPTVPQAKSAPPAQPAAQAQRNPHAGYVYPAGGRQGDTFQVTVGGQFLDGVSEVHVSGVGVKATVVEYIKPMPPQQATQLRDKLKELQDKKAAALGLPAPAAPGSAPPAPASSAPAAPPAAAPPGPKPTWTAEDEAMVAEVRKELAKFVRKPSSPAIAETVTLQVTMAADAEPGHRELRLGTPAGLTNPLVFCVGQLPEFSAETVKHAAEPTKSVARREMAITLPATVNGQIMAGGVDRYKFQARQGQRLVVAVSARDLIPYLADAVPGWFQATVALFDAKGNELAYDDDFRFNPDPVLYYQIPRDGEYAIEIKDAIYRGREDFVYRISVGELPFVTDIFPLGGRAGTQTSVEVRGWNLPVARITMDARNKGPGMYPLSESKADEMSNRVPFAVDTLPEVLEQEPNNQPAGAQAVTLPVIVNGRIGAPGDWDVFRFEGHGGDEVVAEVYARRLNSPLDSVLKLTDAAGKMLAFNDDHEDKGSGLNTHHADSWLRARLPVDGTYYVHIGDIQNKGGPEYAYRLRISPPRPDFELRLAPSSLTVRGGTSTPITVYALRRDGFSGEIALALKGAPAGFTLSSNRVPAGQDQVTLTLTVRPMPAKELVSLRLEGRATIEGHEVARPVVPAEDMMQAFAYRHLVPSQELMVAVRPGAARAGGGGQGASPSLKAAATLVAKYVVKEVDLAADKADKFVSAYVAEREAGLARLRSATAAGDREKTMTVQVDNSKAMLAVLTAHLTGEQVRKAAAILRPLSGELDREVAFLLDSKAPQDKVEKALPVLSKYETAAADGIYSKALAGQMSREDALVKIKELRIQAAKELAAILGDDIAQKWVDRPGVGFGGGGAANAK
jgi:hypothetical protein